MAEKDVLELLFFEDVEFTDTQPSRPVGPNVYVYRERQPDMLADGWKWKAAGSVRRPVKQPVYRKATYYYESQQGIEKTFQRHVYERLDNEARVVVVYQGEPICDVPGSHGNSLCSKPFVRTNPSLLAKIKQVVSDGDGRAGAAKLYKEAVRTTDTSDERACPRDMKQVCNVVQSVRGVGRAASDGLYNVARRILEVDYIHVLEMTQDNMCVVAGLPDMVSDFKEVNQGTQPVVYYDTTFSMGDFYVSALLYRHSVFVGAPVMPLLVLIHEKRSTDSHTLLFQWFQRLTGVTSVTCIADREKSITNAIRQVLPQSSILYCWNHILGDVKAWVKNSGGSATDECFYADTVRTLLAVSDASQFEGRLAEVSCRWSPAFVAYFGGDLKDAVLSSTSFALAANELTPVPYVGITNNVSESYNRVLKDFQNWKERPIDTVIDGFIHLQQFHVKEIARGLAGAGGYRLRPGFPVCNAVPQTVNYVMEPSSIVTTLQDSSAQINNVRPHQQPAFVTECQSDIAHAHLLSTRVRLHDGVWLVDDNVRMNDTFMVKLKDSSCSCDFPGCIHLLAVRIAAGLPVGPKRKQPNLSALRRRCRAGRKLGRKRGLDTTELCAPDSVKSKKVKPRDAACHLETVVEQCEDETSTHAESVQAFVPPPVTEVKQAVKSSHRSLNFGSTPASKLPDIEAIDWSPSPVQQDQQPTSNTNEQSPGEDCAITDVVSGKSPGSLVATEGRWLTGTEIDHVQQLLKSHWTDQGLQSTTTVFTQPMPRPFIQVLFSPVRAHWLTVYGAGKQVTVYDSSAGSVSQQTRATVRLLAGPRTRIKYCRTCTQQTEPGDCGCFALAYATILALGEDPGSYEMVPELVRPHLSTIIRTDSVTKFPYRKHCYCNGQAGGRMIACDQCSQWYHMPCLSRAVTTQVWLCKRCTASQQQPVDEPSC